RRLHGKNWAESRGFRLVLLHDGIVTIDLRAGNTTVLPVLHKAPELFAAAIFTGGKEGVARLTWYEQKKNIVCRAPPSDPIMRSSSSSAFQPNAGDADELEIAVDQAIAACDGNLRATIRALILANDFLENEVRELMNAVSHAYVRGRFQS